MTFRIKTVAAAAAAALLFGAAPVRAGKQAVAVFPPENLSGASTAQFAPLIAPALAEKLGDRFDARVAKAGAAGDRSAVRRQARTLGAAYVVTGSLSRIGKAVTIDLAIAPTEDPGRVRAVVVSGTDAGPAPADGGLPPVYRRLIVEASAKLKYMFFGDEVLGEGELRRRIPRPTGAVVRSRTVPGDVVSMASGDTDGDGKREIVAAFPGGMTVFSVPGDDLLEKARIAGPGAGYFHVEVADLSGKGIGAVIAARYQDGKVASDIFEFDGKGYRAIATELPYFVRAVSLGAEGTVLVGQDGDPGAIFAGPIRRLALDREGAGAVRERGQPLPLPAGTWIYDFAPVRRGSDLRYVVLDAKGRPALYDASGKPLGEGFDAVGGTECRLESAVAPPGTPGAQKLVRAVPPRILATDLDGDGMDEVVILNNLAAAGWFFEGILVYANSEALAFAQDGDGLRLAWRTPQIEGSAEDAFVEPGAGGKGGRIGIASRRAGRLLSGLGEWSVLWLR